MQSFWQIVWNLQLLLRHNAAQSTVPLVLFFVFIFTGTASDLILLGLVDGLEIILEFVQTLFCVLSHSN